MATAEQYAEWLVANQDKQGTSEFSTVAEAYKLARSGAGAKSEAIPTSKAATFKDIALEGPLGVGVRTIPRALVNAGAMLPAMLSDAVTGPLNFAQDKLLGQGQGYRFKAQLPELNRQLSNMGLPEPQGAGERIGSDALASGLSTAGLGNLAQRGVDAGMRVLTPLATNIPAQVAASMSGSVGGNLATEAGASPTTAMAVSVLASLFPGVFPAVMRPITPKTWTHAKRLDTQGRLLNDAVGNQKQQVISELDNYVPNVPGEKFSAGQASSTNPVFAAIDKVARRAYNSRGVSESDAATKAARQGAVGEISRTPADLKKALNTREAVAEKAYKRAFDEGVDPAWISALSPQLKNLMGREEIITSMRRAAQLANSEGYTVGKAPTVASLQYLKQALQDKINKLNPQEMNTKRIYEGTMHDLKSVIDDLSPASRQADKVYARLSREPNRMQVGAELQNKLVDSLGGEKPRVFATAVENLPQLSEKVTGGVPVNFTPQQMERLVGVRNSLEQGNAYNQQASLGTTQARQLIGERLDPLQAPPILNRYVTIARSILEKYGLTKGRQTMEELSQVLQDPHATAELMRRATPSELAAVKQILGANTPVGLLGATMPVAQTGLLR